MPFCYCINFVIHIKKNSNYSKRYLENDRSLELLSEELNVGATARVSKIACVDSDASVSDGNRRIGDESE